MTPKQILDSFSETLIQDHRILSPQERDLLVNLLQHVKTAGGTNPETQQAVRSVIASAVGETVAHRAFSVLGANIVQQILENSQFKNTETADSRTTLDAQIPESSATTRVYAGPHPPSPEPQPPGLPRRAPLPPASEPQPPGMPRRAPIPPAPEPQPPGSPLRGPHPPSPEPQPPGPGARTKAVSETSVSVREYPSLLPARCVVLDEFLAPEELRTLMAFTLNHEGEFRTSEVVSPAGDESEIDYEHRRSSVLMDIGPHQDVILDRIKTVLPQILRKLDMEDFRIANVEAQITASNDGDFFRFHSDSGSERVASRYLTFVYFFHQEPREFEDGDLRIHDARLEDGRYVSQGSYQAITPQQNQIVFFPCDLLHEITPVKCRSRRFVDSRFTLNGWLRR